MKDKMVPISQKNYPTVKFQITDPPKVWVSAFPTVNVNDNLALAVVQKMEKWPPFCEKSKVILKLRIEQIAQENIYMGKKKNNMLFPKTFELFFSLP